jgi:hypothetical protein
MNEETVRFVAQTLLQVELLVLGILQGLNSLPLDTRSAQMILGYNEEDGVKVEIFASGLGRVHSFSHSCSSEMQWRQIILARVESALAMGNRWTNFIGDTENGELVLSFSLAESTSATCLSEADLKSIGGDRFMMGGSMRRC